MRKKISSILIGILVVFVGVFASACGDKYKDFKFSLTYAFSEDAENWYNANDGISLNYLEDGNEYVFDVNGNEERVDKNNFNIYLKVDVKNVKSKHLDSVTVSAEGSSGLSFSSSTIKNGKTVKLPIVGLVNSQLSFYENKSGKSAKIDLTVYGKLTDIARNTNLTPALTIGNSIDLNSLESLILYNQISGITTNQTGVEFAFDSFGNFNDTGVFVPDSASNNLFNKQFVSLVNGKLKLNQEIRVAAGKREFALNSANNVIRIKATSVYNSEVSTNIYVYVVENDLPSPVVTFATGANAGVSVNSTDLTRTGLDLYFNSTSYVSSAVEVSDVNSIYNSENLKTADGNSLKFKKVIYIGNSVEPYILGSSEPVRNLRISENAGKYTITLLTQSVEEKVNVKFAYELVCEKDGETYPVTFTQGKPNLATSVEVRKHILPSSILINGNEYINGQSINGVVYSALNYKPYTIQLGIDPVDRYALEPQNTIISGISNLDVKDNYLRTINDNDAVGLNSTLTIKFKNNVYDQQEVKIKTLSTPTYFNGQAATSRDYIEVTLNLKRQVTADALEFVNPVYDETDASIKYEETSTINVATNKTSYIYVRAYYHGELETNTLTLLSDGFALNRSGDKKILLDADNVTQVLVKDGYSVYKIEVPATENISTSNLQVYAGELGYGASDNVDLVSVELINDDTKIQVLPKDNTNVTSFGNNKFAIVNNEDITFNVVEDVSGEKVHKTIKNVTLTDANVVMTNAGDIDKFGRAEVLVKTEFRNTNTFNIHGWNAKTRVFNVNAEYYDLIDLDGDGYPDTVALQTKTINNVQFAVYNPITSITLSVTNPKIAYVNSMYPEAATTEISYKSRSGIGSDVPTQTVYFANNDGTLNTVSGATSVQVALDKELDTSQVNLYNLVGHSYNLLTNEDEILLRNANIEGKLKLQLTNVFTRYPYVKFIAIAERFGELSSTQNDIEVVFAQVEKATGFNITKGDIVEYSKESRELQLSFLGVEGDTVSKSFGAAPTYPSVIPAENTLQFKDITYSLYKYEYKDGVLQYEGDGKTPKLSPITDLANSLKIENNAGQITVTADKTKANIGGLYRLILSTKDSYQDDGTFGVSWSVDVRVSDGKTVDAAYIVKTPEEFMSINNDLTAHYILGDNITITADMLKKEEYGPIGFANSAVTPFKGSLSGRLQTFTESSTSSISNYNLSVTLVNKYRQSDVTSNKLYGLFTILEGSISNLNIHIGFLDGTDGITTSGKSIVGGIAAINRGKIENVYTYLTGVVNIEGETNFGGIVGANENGAMIKNCMVDSSNLLTINAKVASNIGGVVGFNEGLFSGKYLGKDSLNNIVYDTVLNMTVNNLAENVAYNIGAVAGVSSTDISNLLVGGQIYINSKAEDDSQLPLNGYLAGIVGVSSANISKVAAVGLDLINAEKNGIKVAGIAGQAANIEDAKFVSVLAKFNSGFETTGQLVGKNVAGIVFAGNVEYSSVESFIKTRNGGTFYTIDGETAYGLINSGSVSNSFVSANIKATGTAYLTSSAVNKTLTYFIGQVDATTRHADKSTYAVVYNDTEFVDISGFTFDETNFNSHVDTTTEPKTLKESWGTEVSKLTNFAVNSNYNIVMVSDFDGVEFYFPYIEKEGKPIMILQPSSIGVAINQKYQISTEENIYIEDVEIKDDITTPTYTLTESIIVDFFKNKYGNNETVNTHFLVNDLCENCETRTGTCATGGNCHKGLIDVSILPSGSTSGLTFEIVQNYMSLATIKENTQIIFSGATNGNPIIIRAYSVFNPEAEAYFALYSQHTFTDLVLDGANVKESVETDVDYIANVYEGRNSLMTLTAENIINGVTYDSIFASNSHYIKVEAETEGDNKDKIIVNTSNLTAISIAIKDNQPIAKNEAPIKLTFKVFLDKAYFGDYSKFEETDIGLELGEINVKVNLVNLATELNIIGSDDFEIDASSTLNIEAELKTGFVNTSDSKTEEVQLSTKVENGIVIVNEEKANDKDSIRMSISSSSSELERVRILTGCNSYTDLFDYEVFEIRTNEGYKYFVNLSLKDEFNYRYITKDIDLALEIWAHSSMNVQNSVNVKIKPTTANTTRLVNYAVESVNVVSDTKSELTVGNIETAIIAPGGRGNIILAYVEKSYSNIDSISISSSELHVPELNKNVNLIFTQYIYNTDTKKFETLFNSDSQSQIGNTLQLQKITTTNNRGETQYTGLLYIHAQLVKFSGLEARITASLNVTSNGKELPAVSKDLLTTFLPGASLNYTGETIRDGYLVQEATYGNSAKIKLYGYQFNSNPIMLVDWYLVDGVDYFYHIDGVDNINLTEETNNNTSLTTEDKKKEHLKTLIEEAFNKGTLYYSLEDDEGIVRYYKATEADLSRTDVTFYSITIKKLIWIDADNDDEVDENEILNVSNYVSPYFVKDYANVDYNPVDGSYTMEVKFNIAKDIPANFTMQTSLSLITSDGQFETALSDKLVFYPSEYVITDISVKNTSGNRKMLAINRTDKFELLFTTLRSDYDFSAEIYDDIFVNDISDIASLFTYYNPTEMTFANNPVEFDVAIRNGYLNVTGLSKFEKEVTLNVWVGYELNNGKFEVVFGEGVGTGLKKYEYTFLLQIYPGAGEENATPIYYAYEMFGEDGTCKLAENGHYILMNDITLDLVKSIDYAIGSLDGNNHIIKIKNFVIDKSKSEYGLFANIGTYQDEEKRSHKTILKNVIVDYSEFNVENSGNIEFTNNEITNVTFGGLVATNNGGLIYNCDVINSNPAANKVINIITDANASVTFGGLVGSNSGVITNSRVGRREFKDIDAKNDSYVNVTFGGLTFTLGSATASGFDVVAGGFVGTNNGIISSSYFANSNLINYSNSKTTNITAGFVGKNNSNSTIVYSYVKANETTITPSSPYATGARIEGKSNGIIAGFVYENAGSISDCYSNTELYTDSTYMAGFVYNNLSSGTISESYAACTMNSKMFGESQDNAEQPFVGKDNEDVYQNYGNMENNYYLISDAGSGDIGLSYAQALNATNFKNPTNLQGFVFVQSNVTAERQQGVWSHIDTKGNSVILPELMNANVIAHSAKYLYSGNGTTEKFVYTNADSYMEGTQENPFIIRNVQEFNNTLTGDRADLSVEISKSGYVRLIDSIDFAENKDAIKTRVKYTLGDANRSNITSFEGNGLSIKGIYFDVSEPSINEIGLFAKVQNAYIKNLNLNFAKPSGGQYSTTLVKYSGGLAGIITNSAIINVNLNGKNVALTGQNYVGGLAGLINGDSLLYGITSNLSVSASSPETGLYYSQKDYTDLGNNASNYNHYISSLSYAGGIAGVIDITNRSNTEYNIAYIDIYGDQMFVKTSDNSVQLPNISGQYAGGIAGFASRETNSLKLKYHTGTTDWISGSVAAGGLFGVSLGSIKASQVTATEDTQFIIDEEFGKYILNVDKGLDITKVGNLNLIESNGYAGGLIGIGLNAGIDASYSKASFKNGKVVGGLVGLSVASHVTYSYANPFVNITDTTKEVGGLFGAAHVIEKNSSIDNNSRIKTYETLTNLYLTRDPASASTTYTDIQFTFSTLLLDKQTLTTLTEDEVELGYVVPKAANDANINSLRCGGNTTFTNVYAGTLEEYSYTKDGYSDPIYPVASNDKVASRDLKILYDLTNNKQETTFSEIFSSWKSVSYWSLKHEKYFPLLTNEGVENYIIIENADDMKMIASNPDGKFLVTKDINMSNWSKNQNWVFDINFTGELIGLIDSASNTRKKIYNISLDPNSVDSSGFFRQTTGALIADLEFVWFDDGTGAIDPTVNNIKQLKSVSGLSCLDMPYSNGANPRTSEFTNIEISVSDNGYLVKQPDDVNKLFNITTFAGLVASTENSTITNCDFVGKADVRLAGETSVYFAGLVGVASKSDDEALKDKSMSIMNSNVGSNGEDTSKTKTEFTIDIVGGTEAVIGGIVANAEDASVWGCNVGGINYKTDYAEIPFNITISSSIASTQSIGGLIGNSVNTAISRCDTNSKIDVSGGSIETDKITNPTIAGLVANYLETKSMDILNSSSNTLINVAKLQAGTLVVSGGIGTISSSGTVDVMKHCLFTGDIIGEKDVAESEESRSGDQDITLANTVIAGGAFGLANKIVKVSETMSTVDMIIGTDNSNEHSVKAGGFAGVVTGDGSVLTLNNVVSTGKLVPICGNNAKLVHLGGLIGSVDNTASAEINNSYTLTSIISDAINGNALEETYSDVLVGYANEIIGEDGNRTISNVETSNVYYSTDFALTTNDHNYGTNLSAYDMVFDSSNIWMANFVTNSNTTNAWKFLEVDSSTGLNRLPFLKGIEDALKKYKVLSLDSDKFDYIKGSSLRPTSTIEDVNKFTYCILNNFVSLTDVKGFSGVLIGKEDDKFTPTSNFLVNKINRHSAVSNVHLYLGKGTTFDLGGSVNGFIANENNGLIFNSSVQGTGIKIANGSALGVIAGTNTGTVAYSYSTVEIIEISCTVAGIVNGNDGIINSCYFTGYINNESVPAAGIMYSKSEGDLGINSYVYNSYMAGVIENVEETHSSFYAGDATTLVGSNNYIDKFANVELDIDVERTVTLGEGEDAHTEVFSVLKSITTAELMARTTLTGEILKGNWYDSVGGTLPNITIDTSSETSSFGKNYGYPIYRFNKIKSQGMGTEPTCSDLDYSLYTGTGEYSTSTPALNDRYAALLSNVAGVVNNEYENAYKIPHLGILSAVHGLQDISRNYIVIYDIDGKMIDWQGVGSEFEKLENFTKTGAFKGVITTNKHLTNSYDETDSSKYICSIQGLNVSGIFDEIGESYIADIEFGSFGKKIEASEGVQAKDGLSNSGAIGNKVVGNTVINNVSFVNNSIIEGNNIGGLFGTVAANVTIANLHTENSFLPALTLQGSGSAGLIASSLGFVEGTNTTEGTITLIYDSDESKPTNVLYPYFKSVNTAGGLVGTAVSGTINGNNHIVNVDLPVSRDYTVGSFGGIIGSVADKGTVTVNNIDVNFYASKPIIAANTFGGFVASVNGSATFTGCRITAPNEVEINSNAAGAKGLVIGKIETSTTTSAVTASVTLTGFELVNDTTFNFVGDNNAGSSIGGIVGYQKGDLKVEYTNSKNVVLITKETPNMGGIIGYYADGNINVSNTATGASVMSEGASQAMTLKGVKNVGGFIGFASVFPQITEGSINFLNLDKEYANIVITENSVENFGGIFGVLTASNTVTESAGGEMTTSTTEDKSYIPVKNKNKFTVEKLKEKERSTVTNLGGIAGFVNSYKENAGTSYATLGELTNEAEINLSEAYGYQFANVGGVIGKFNGAKLEKSTNSAKILSNVVVVKDTPALANATLASDKVNNYPITKNVGGIIGLAQSDSSESIKLIDLKNEEGINGYQNVGGIVGCAIKAKITGKITLTGTGISIDQDGKVENATISEKLSSIIISGVVNVGGVAGYVEGSTIQQVYSTVNVYGNVNVGGIAGLANDNSTIQNNYFGYSGDTLKETNAIVKALYYNVYISKDEYITYIPTSVGGLIGTSNKTTIQSNILQNVQILSADEGKETSNTKNSKGIISTIKNHMAKVGFGEGASNTINDFTDINIDKVYLLGNEGQSDRTLEFANIQSGFGGFVGTIDSIKNVIMDAIAEGETTEAKSSYMRNVTINAPLGVNVGTFYGVYKHEDSFNAPTIYGTINVDGAYNVGSVSGKLNASEIKNFSNENLQGQATIHVQSNLSGMYIGGLFGEVISDDIEHLNIVDSDVKINIHTDSSYYIGGLVGKLTVNQNNNFDVCDSNGLIVTGNPAQNFGGLVGILKCAGSVGEYEVKGTHKYAFTVNTIENQNYKEGKSQFDATEQDGNILLNAQAYYINQDSFNISATSNADYYSSTAKNPVRSDSSGWAKEYTGFKQVQRCIPAKDNNGAGWDSIAFVYNAENITNVGTIANIYNGSIPENSVIKKGTDEDDNPYYYYKGDGDKEIKLHDQFIVYTVYEKDSTKSMLYSPMGIAELATMPNGKLVTSDSNHYTDAQEDESKDYFVSDNSDRTGLTEYYWSRAISDVTFAGMDGDGKRYEKNYESVSTETLLRFDWKDKGTQKIIIDIDEDKKVHKKIDVLESAYYYEINSKYYDFKSIYANSTTPEFKDNLGDTACPESGSVFEISGMNPQFNVTEEKYGSATWEWWQWALVGLLVIAIVIGICFLAAYAAPVAAWITGKLGAIMITTKLTIGIGALVVAVGVVGGYVAIIGIALWTAVAGVNTATQTFFSTKNQNLGLLTSTIISEVRYSDGKMVADNIRIVNVKDEDGAEYSYYYYSTTKPSDYYSNYYVVDADLENLNFNEFSLTEGVSSEEKTIDVNKDNKQIYSIGTNKYGYHYGETAGTEVNAYKKYIFYEGNYYYIDLSIKMGTYATSELNVLDEDKFKEWEYAYNSNGLLYVKSGYNSTTNQYYYDQENSTSRLKYDASKKVYTVNGKEIKNAVYEKMVDFEYVGSSTPDSIDGFKILKGAYYTTNQLSSNETYLGLKKYATFTYASEKPNGTAGIDYIERSNVYYVENNVTGNYKLVDGEYVPLTESDINADGTYKTTRYEQKSQTVYFKIADSASSENESVVKNANGEITGGSVSLAVYPYSLYNPHYKEETGNQFGGIKDSNFYQNKLSVNDSGEFTSKFTIPAKVCYYYYENGYETAVDLGLTYDKFIPKDPTIDSTTEAELNKLISQFIYIEAKFTEADFEKTLTLYEGETEKTKISYKDLFGLSKSEDDKISYSKGTNYDNNKSYTITPLKDDAGKEMYQLASNYVFKGDKLYIRNDLYTLKDGVIHKYYRIPISGDKEAYKNNKYLTNKDWGVFTLLRYIDGTGKILNFEYVDKDLSVFVNKNGTPGTEDDENYLLIPTVVNKSRPNGMTTYLVETCKVTLGGGLTLNYTQNSRTKGCKSGTITIE